MINMIRNFDIIVPNNVIDIFWSKVYKTDYCWFWIGRTNHLGYGDLYFWSPHLNKYIHYKTHRFIWQLNNGPIPDNKIILHECDIYNCVRLDHLKLGTRLRNER